MGKGYRQGRLGEEIRRIISEMIFRELKDPRLTENMISITAVDVTSDGSYATAFVSVFKPDAGDDEMSEINENVISALQGSKGVIKREIGKQIRLKHIPELLFKIDGSLDYGRKMEELISKVIKEQDEE